MDSFFEFDTHLPADDEDAANRSCPQARNSNCQSSLQRRFNSEDNQSDEEQYDALNDETFGTVDKGDWEDIHENLVQLERCRNGRFSGVLGDDGDGRSSSDMLFDDYDLDLQLSKLTNYDTNDESDRGSVVAQSIGDEFASKLRLDPSIWGSPVKVSTGAAQQSPFPPNEQGKSLLRSGLVPPMNMLSVEDIERSIIRNQHQQNQHQQTLLQMHEQMAQQQQHQTLNTLRQPVPGPPKRCDPHTPIKEAKSGMISSPIAVVQPMHATPPPQLTTTRNGPLLPPMRGSVPAPTPFLNHHPNRLPPGFGLPPYNMLATRPFSTPINNLAMHPGFSYGSYGTALLRAPMAMGTALLQPPPPAAVPPTTAAPFLVRRSVTPLPHNQFNQRLVQEIQQNHPLLVLNRQLVHTYQVSGNSCAQGYKYLVPCQLKQTFATKPLQQPSSPYQQVQYYIQQQMQMQQQRSRQAIGAQLGGPRREAPDEYANMMSQRDKQWLIGIQLMQLNADTPYISDYYFTVYRQRLATGKGGGMGENRLNFPFTQTNGDGRERRSSEPKPVPPGPANGNDAMDGTVGGRTYTPLRFENSLGKLQCGSVVAPRKLIDVDVMGGGSDHSPSRNCPSGEHPVGQRKARHVLLLIEELYKIVLKLEDLFNPAAISAAAYMREKRLLLMEGEPELPVVPPSEPVETFDELSTALIRTLSLDKVTAILCVRKGRILLRRALVALHAHKNRWWLWAMIISAFPCLPRKDRDEADGLMLALLTEFERQARCGRVQDLVLVAKSLSGSDKVMSCLAGSKFLLSCVIAIIFQMELFCGKNPSTLHKLCEREWWIKFLAQVNQAVKDSITPFGVRNAPVRTTIITINPDDNTIRTLRVHFARFGTLVDGTHLLNFITDNGNGK